MFLRSIGILVLLNLYCYASPIPSAEHHEKPSTIIHTIHHQSHMKDPMVSKPYDDDDADEDLTPFHNLHQYEFMKILCEFYEHCSDDDTNDEQQITEYDDPKSKRLSSGLFHGIPKFGKRAFSSAFSGIPKFG